MFLFSDFQNHRQLFFATKPKMVIQASKTRAFSILGSVWRLKALAKVAHIVNGLLDTCRRSPTILRCVPFGDLNSICATKILRDESVRGNNRRPKTLTRKQKGNGINIKKQWIKQSDPKLFVSRSEFVLLIQVRHKFSRNIWLLIFGLSDLKTS